MKKKFKYIQVYEELRDSILQGERKPGDKLESEVDLSKIYNINYHTIRKSLKLLEKDGLIERRVGAGSFITAPTRKKATGKESRSSAGIGMLILPDAGAYTMNMIEALDNEAVKRGHYLNVRPIRAFDTNALNAAEQLKRSGCSSVVIPRFSDGSTQQFVDFVKQCPLPVSIPEPIPGLSDNCFYRAGFSGHLDYSLPALAFDYFKSAGLKNIAYLGPTATTSDPAERRIAAYDSLADRYGYPCIKGLVGNSFEEIDSLVHQWADAYDRVAVICYDDTYALRLITALHKLSYGIPSKFAVIGANNSPECLTSDPALSSIALPYKEMAEGLIGHALAMSIGQSQQQTTTGCGILKIRKSG